MLKKNANKTSHLRELEISNFKCFGSEKIKFAPLTVLVGGNGAGNATIIQSLERMQLTYTMQTEYHKEYISINEKEKSFLELGSVKQLLSENSNRKNKSKTIQFNLNKDKVNPIIFQIKEKKNQNLFFDEISNEAFSNLSLFQKDFYYLNAERIGPRNYQSIAGLDSLNVGFQGEFTGQVILKISNEDTPLKDSSRFLPEESNQLILKQIEGWMDFIIPGVEIRPLVDSSELHLTRVEIKKKGSGTDFLHPNNIGFGITYSLPIVVTGLLANNKSMFIVENPEAHLHPRSQSRMGQFLAKMAGTGTQTVIETHSEHIVNGICLAIVKGFISPNDVIINFFDQENGEVNIEEIKISKNGDFDKWPEGFFDQTLKDIAEIRERSAKT